MKTLASAAAVSLLFASTAAAGGITFSLPNLHFPPADAETVTQDCQSFDATSDTCIVDE